MKQGWGVIEAGQFLSNWHVDYIGEYVEAAVRFEIRRLIVTIPPRFSKSTIISVFTPPWIWTRHPEHRFITASYSAILSVRDSVRSRRIIGSPWYQRNWGNVFRLSGDQNVKSRYENDKTGFRMATSVGGSVVGEGADTIIVDDPHNLKEINSEASREAVKGWWDEVMTTRVNDPNRNAKIIIMQRAHEDDLVNHLLTKASGDSWTQLKLPMEAPAKTTVQFLSGKVKVRERGDLLWGERFNRAAVEEWKEDLGTHAASAQLQQEPTPRGGNMLRGDRVVFVDKMPEGLRWVRGWDLASTKKERAKRDPDFTVGTKVAWHNETLYVADVTRGQWSTLQRDETIKNTANRDGRNVLVYIEAVAGYKDAYSYVKKFLRGFASVRLYNPDTDKVARAAFLEAIFEAGNVVALKAEWNDVWVAEILSFPDGTHDDQVDSLVCASHSLVGAGGRMNLSS